MVVRSLVAGRSLPVCLGLSLRHHANVRATLVRARRSAAILAWGAAVVGVVVLALAPWLQPSTAQAGLGTALGGATGNVLDAVRRRSIIDFIDVGFWPVFNVADLAIVTGIAMTLLGAQV